MSVIASDIRNTRLKNIYVIGGPGTGKTELARSLTNKLHEAFQDGRIHKRPQYLPNREYETFREMVLPGDDLFAAGDAAAGESAPASQVRRVQTRALHRACVAELRVQRGLLVVDRTGADAVAHATFFGDLALGRALADRHEWEYLKRRMCVGFVVLCRPDGVPESNGSAGLRGEDVAARLRLHAVYRGLLRGSQIAFHGVAGAPSAARTDEVLRLWYEQVRDPDGHDQGGNDQDNDDGDSSEFLTNGIH